MPDDEDDADQDPQDDADEEDEAEEYDQDEYDQDEYEDAEFTIRSDEAYIAAATITCRHCDRPFEVICLHCRSGTVFEEPLREFTVCNIHRVDRTLAEQLRAWPGFRQLEFRDADHGPEDDPGDFANQCPSCGAVYEDAFLHDEPGDPFFDIPHAPPGAIRLTALSGTIQLSGDEHYDVE